MKLAQQQRSLDAMAKWSADPFPSAISCSSSLCISNTRLSSVSLIIPLQVAVPYDWRLPLGVMESRDGYFTRVKQEVELQYQLSQGIKPVMVSHSYGAQVSLAFLDWVERQNPGWVDKHLEGYVNVAGPMLGLPKALSPLLSGERSQPGYCLNARLPSIASINDSWR